MLGAGKLELQRGEKASEGKAYAYERVLCFLTSGEKIENPFTNEEEF